MYTQYGQTDLWYDDSHTEAQYIKGWNNLLARFGGKANLMGIDLKNEPNGRATWGMNNP